MLTDAGGNDRIAIFAQIIQDADGVLRNNAGELTIVVERIGLFPLGNSLLSRSNRPGLVRRDQFAQYLITDHSHLGLLDLVQF